MRVGSLVRVTHRGAIYPGYRSFFTKNGIGHYLDKFSSNVDNGDTGVVLFIGPHEMDKDLMVCVVALDKDENKIILIGERGIVCIGESPMFDEEITPGDMEISDLLGF